MMRRTIAVAWLSFMTLPGRLGLCQPPQVTEVQPPDWIIYDSFFNRVKWMEDIAEKSAAAGGNAAAVRSTIRRQAGLTEQEDAALKAVVAEWWKALMAAQDEVQARRGAAEGPPDPQLRRDYAADHRKITEEAVERLKARLGPARFAQLNGFVHATSNVKAVQLTRPSNPQDARSK